MGETIEKEALLIQQAQGGDVRSFSALVEIYQERAVHIAYSFLGNFEDAKDIAQEAFVKSYDNLSGFKTESRFYTWFYRILVNTCKDFLRKKKVRKHLNFWLNRNGDEEGNPLENIADHGTNALQNIVNRELGDEILKAVDQLPFQQRSAFNLRYLEGMSLEEIAAVMGLSLGAVKATLWQAGQKMKKFLVGFAPTGG